MGAQALATGHYARLSVDEQGRPLLRRAVDLAKDQAYFLYPLRPRVADFVRFPLGEMHKDQVRDHARRLGVAVADKPESMDICFTSARTPAEFVADRGAAISGQLVDLRGTSLARHGNLASFTVGQRRRLGLPTGAASEPKRFVVEKRSDGTVIVGPRELLAVHALVVSDYCSVTGEQPIVGQTLTVQARHRGQPVAAVVSGVRDDVIDIQILGDLEAAARGQSAVLWDDDRLLGGGIIETVDSAASRQLHQGV